MTDTTPAHAVDGRDVLEPFRKALRNYRSQSCGPEERLFGSLEILKRTAVENDDEMLANAVWCLQEIGQAQSLYAAAFHACKESRFYDAWQLFERAEIRLRFLGRHYEESHEDYGLAFMQQQVARFQSLFPYKIFFSPGYIIEEARCSICSAVLTPRSRCGHKRFGLYGGEMCARNIVRAQALEVSLVTRPVQKYSIAFPEGMRYDYRLVHYAISGLQSPWDGWRVEVQKRRIEDPAMQQPPFRNAKPNQRCPCGSGSKFKRCCSPRRFRDIDHHEFFFEVPPPDSLPRLLVNDEARYDAHEPFQRDGIVPCNAEDASMAGDPSASVDSTTNE